MNRIENVYGLTPVQEGIYAQYFQNKATDAYHLYYLFSVADSTDPAVLRQALELLPLRHPVLKTAFAVVEGTVKQVVLTDRKPTVRTRYFDGVYTCEALENAVREEKAFPMDLQRDPLVRCTFLLFSDKRFLFFHTHHLIIDGWCASVLFDDVSAFYRALANGETADELRRRIAAQQKAETSFADYVRVLRGRDAGEARAYWRRLLADRTPAPLPRRIPAAGADGIKRTVTALPPETVRRALRFAHAQALSLNTLLESAFALALQKHTGKSDVVFLKVISGRSFGPAKTERTVGPMINTVPVRARREDTTTPLLFLKNIGEQSANANEYGFLPLAEVCRTGGFSPNDADALFDYGNYPAPEAAVTGQLQLLEQQERTEFPLTCAVTGTDETLRLTVTNDASVHPSSCVQALSESFLSALLRISALEGSQLNDAAELARLLRTLPDGRNGARTEAFSAGKTLPIPDESIYALFVKQTNISPEKTAVIFKDRPVSFGSLLERADSAADRLAELGVRAGDVVAVHLDRSTLLIVLQLAVLKLGAVFLPVDRRFPENRVRFLCRDCGARLLITDEAGFDAGETQTVPSNTLAQARNGPPHVPETRGDNCYIIYTSGSTGTPKGCLLRQTGLVNFCVNNNTLKTLKRREHNVFAAVNSASFDYFIAESLLPLLNGYTVVLCDEDESLLQRLFLDVVRRHGVNVLMTTPTRLALFYDPAPDCAPLRGLDCVCSSGEPLPEKLLARIYEVSPAAKVYNPLGPSECTVWDLGGELDRNAGTDVHLGRPIPNARIYILDESLQPVPVGVTGELCIAGAGVGAGYINRPELTAERFVDDPFGEGKLYRTGDLAYWREDGNAAFVGRNDFQIKLNGLRIEPHEIENALLSADGIENAAVTVQTDENGQPTLCAFYTGTETDAGALRGLLGLTLPRYMIPHVFIRLEAMPLTAHGKIDRAALKNASAARRSDESGYLPPQTDTEKAVCGAFAAILHQTEVSRNADFFRLGGTSLQLVRLLSQPPLERLTPSDFLTDPTPAGLAKKLDAAERSDYTYLVPLYTPANAKKAVVLFPFAGGDAAAYTALLAKARERKSEVSLYFVGWPEADALAAAAGEINKAAKEMPLYFYSHCAGACIALSLLDKLNEKERVVKGYVAGAAVPPRKSLAGINLWAHLPDDTIKKSLVSAGLHTGPEGEDLLRERLRDFRRHTEICSAYFRDKTEKTNVCVTAVLSRNDPFTRNYADARQRWMRIVEKVDRVILTDTPSHYFQNTDTDLLLDLFAGLQ